MTKKLLPLLLLLGGLYGAENSAQSQTRFNRPFAPQEGFVATPERPCRDEICLNGRWKFMPVETEGMTPEQLKTQTYPDGPRMGRRGVQGSLAVERQRLLPRRRRRLRRLSQLPGGLGARAGRMAAKEGADTRRLGPPPHNPALRSGRRICARIRQRQPRMREFRSLPALLRRRHGLRTSRTGDRSHGVGRPRIAVRRTRKIREKTLHRRLVLGQPHCGHLAGRLPAELSGGLHRRPPTSTQTWPATGSPPS